MKRTIALIVCLITISYSSNAQTQFGLKGGINLANNAVINAPDQFNSSNAYRIGYHAGVFAKFGLSDKFSLSPELLFSTKGHKFDDPTSLQPIEGGSLHLDYINLPLLAGYEVFDNLTLKLGPELGYLLSAKSKFGSETADANQSFDNSLDFGLLGSLSYSLGDKIILDIRYLHGLSAVADFQLTDENGVPMDNVVKYKNRVFQFSVGYRLR